MQECNIVRTAESAMSVTLGYIRCGDTVVDATCGTGQDTVRLAKAAGETGRVVAFDIQEAAIGQTAARLRENGCTNTELVHGTFADMGKYVPDENAAAVVFNLGYLPGGDHSVTTTAEETLAGLEAALRAVRPGGIVTAVLYSGHEEGAREKQAVLEWAEKLDSRRFHAAFVQMINQHRNPPEILWITKK